METEAQRNCLGGKGKRKMNYAEEKANERKERKSFSPSRLARGFKDKRATRDLARRHRRGYKALEVKDLADKEKLWRSF